MFHRPRTLFAASALVLGTAGLAACGDDDSDSTATTAAPAPPITAEPVPPTTADGGGGGMQAGAPSFETFTVTSPVPCQGGNATTTMAFTTMNVVQIEIKIGDGSFEGTAGYNPDETDAVASIPCDGAGESTVQLRGCTEDDECATSEEKSVTITG